MISDVNVTNSALRVLDEHMFTPALAAIDEQFSEQPLIRARLLQTMAEAQGTVGLIDRVEAPRIEAL